MSEETATVMKRGEICIQATLHRNLQGLSISVKAHPRVEEFIKSLGGNGAIEDVRRHGRFWTPLDREKGLTVHSITQSLGVIPMGGGNYFRIDRIGQPILDPDTAVGGNMGGINFSFIRLVGISEGAGITFKINGVYTLDAIRRMRDMIGEAAQTFYVSYLKPIDLDVQISTQEYFTR